MSAEVARVLRNAADLIEPEGRWTQCAAARDGEGRKVTPGDPRAVEWCGAGAIRRVAGGFGDVSDVAERAMNAWRDVVGHWLVGSWNDDKGRTADEVVAALRAAADEAEAE